MLIRGASGPYAHFINGAFLLREGLFNGSPQFQNDDDQDKWLLVDKDGSWAVMSKSSKDANNGSCICRSVKKGLPIPHMAKEWMVYNDRFVRQPQVVASKLVRLAYPFICCLLNY